MCFWWSSIVRMLKYSKICYVCGYTFEMARIDHDHHNDHRLVTAIKNDKITKNNASCDCKKIKQPYS